MIRRFTLALALLLAACGANPAFAAPAPLLLKNMVGKTVDGGHFSRITLINCRDCTVRNATVTPPPAISINDQAVRVTGSPGAIIEGLTVTGQAATTGVAQTAPGPAGLVIGLWAGEGIHVDTSPGAVISHNVITKFHQGISFGGDGVVIDGNTIANMRTSGIVGVPGDNVTINGNGIGASFPWRWGQTPAGDHGDKIHLWTAGGRTVTGLTITNNVLDDGKGVAILGIFLQNKSGNFANVTIERNTIRIGQTLAMMLTGTRGSVSFNTLVPLNFKKPAAIYSSYGNAGLWQGNTGGKGVVFNAKLTAAQRALVTVKP